MVVLCQEGRHEDGAINIECCVPPAVREIQYLHVRKHSHSISSYSATLLHILTGEWEQANLQFSVTCG